MRKDKVEIYRSLDVRRWARDGLIVPGNSFGWNWIDDDGEKVASIRVEINDEQSLALQYHCKSGDDDGRDFLFPIGLVKTPCNYGGDRFWFECPHCGRRVAILYLTKDGWFYRHSLDLVYSSQSEGVLQRIDRRKSKLEDKLFAADGSKPRGMHWKTYGLLQNLWAGYEMVWLDAFIERLGA